MLWGVAGFGLAACAPTVFDPSGRPQAPRLEAGTYHADDGAALPLMAWGPADAPSAVVLGLHGFADYSNAFAKVGERLAAQGIRTVAYDQRGFGGAPGRGYWHAADAVSLLAEAYAPAPVYVLGLSMGGAVAMTTAARRPGLPLAGVGLVAPAVLQLNLVPAVARAGFWTAAHTIPWYPLKGTGFKVRASDNLEMLRRMSRDPMILRLFRVDQLWGLVHAMDTAVAASSRLTLPTLFMYGLRDELVPLPMMTRTALYVPGPNRRVAIYPDGFHMLLRDLRGDVAIDDLAAWIADPSAPLPSGADRDGISRLLAADSG